MARCTRDVVLRIIEQEKKRLDNASVFGGFHRFLRNWLSGEDDRKKEWLEKLDVYETLPPQEKRELLLSIERALKGEGPPSPPKTSRDDHTPFSAGTIPQRCWAIS